MSQSAPIKRISAFLTLSTFFIWTILTPAGLAQPRPVSWNALPEPSQIPALGQLYVPPLLNGMTVHPQDPFRFDFLMTLGDERGLKGEALKDEAERLIRYFLAALAIPEQDLWVNLSPFEDGRIVPSNLGATEMGRDLLAEDYLLKQMTAALLHPENEWGKRFWRQVYAKAAEEYGTIDIPVNTFNKVWVLPDTAEVYQEGHNAYIAEAKLKVMLEEDMLQLEAQRGSNRFGLNKIGQAETERINAMASELLRRVIVPVLTKEVNESAHFAKLRQIYHGIVLATWFKKNLRENLINKIYSDHSKITGIDLADESQREAIYQRYLKAYQRGAYEIIKEEIDPLTQEMIPRRYFTGGANFQRISPQIKDYEREDPRAEKARKKVIRTLMMEGLLGSTSPSEETRHLKEMDFEKPTDVLKELKDRFLGETSLSNVVSVGTVLMQAREENREGVWPRRLFSNNSTREIIRTRLKVQQRMIEEWSRGGQRRGVEPQLLTLEDLTTGSISRDEVLRAVADLVREGLGSTDRFQDEVPASTIRNEAGLIGADPKLIKQALERFGPEIGLVRVGNGLWASSNSPKARKGSVGAARRGVPFDDNGGAQLNTPSPNTDEITFQVRQVLEQAHRRRLSLTPQMIANETRSDLQHVRAALEKIRQEEERKTSDILAELTEIPITQSRWTQHADPTKYQPDQIQQISPGETIDSIRSLVSALVSSRREEMKRLGADGLPQPSERLIIETVNTSRLGGVGDILNAVARYASYFKTDFHWKRLGLPEALPPITKKIHNHLHEAENVSPLTDEEKHVFEQFSTAAASHLKKEIETAMERGEYIPPDVILVNDPQPIAVYPILQREFPEFFNRVFGNTRFILFFHIPTKGIDNPQSPAYQTWDFLLPYINWYDAFVMHKTKGLFPQDDGTTHKSPRGVKTLFLRNVNSIDPLDPINIKLDDSFVELVQGRLLDPRVHQYVIHNSRFDRLKAKDISLRSWMEKIKQLKKYEEKRLGIVLTGPLAADDSEGMEVLREIALEAQAFNDLLNDGLSRTDDNYIEYIMVRPILPKGELSEEQINMLKAWGLDPTKALPQLDEEEKNLLKNMALSNENLKHLNPDQWEGMDVEVRDAIQQNLILNALMTGRSKQKVVALLQPSREEGFSLAATSAKWAAGKNETAVVIVSDRGGLGPQIKHGVNGFKIGLNDDEKTGRVGFKAPVNWEAIENRDKKYAEEGARETWLFSKNPGIEKMMRQGINSLVKTFHKFIHIDINTLRADEIKEIDKKKEEFKIQFLNTWRKIHIDALLEHQDVNTRHEAYRRRWRVAARETLAHILSDEKMFPDVMFPEVMADILLDRLQETPEWSSRDLSSVEEAEKLWLDLFNKSDRIEKPLLDQVLDPQNAAFRIDELMRLEMAFYREKVFEITKNDIKILAEEAKLDVSTNYITPQQFKQWIEWINIIHNKEKDTWDKFYRLAKRFPEGQTFTSAGTGVSPEEMERMADRGLIEEETAEEGGHKKYSVTPYGADRFGDHTHEVASRLREPQRDRPSHADLRLLGPKELIQGLAERILKERLSESPRSAQERGQPLRRSELAEAVREEWNKIYHDSEDGRPPEQELEKQIAVSLDEAALKLGLEAQPVPEFPDVIYKLRTVGGILLDPMYLEMSLTGEMDYSPADLRMLETNLQNIEGLKPQIINIIHLPVEVLPRLFSQTTEPSPPSAESSLTLSAR